MTARSNERSGLTLCADNMNAEERAKGIAAAERNAFLLIGWAKRSADNGFTEKALHLAQAALAIAQAAQILKVP
ncbi:hypothetical protein [Agrobacterium cavarae]|uniref:hypothetical protein n=1 Tax=Agrobacterium cavarae TaxID=2528239 RepID=UPI003FD28F58